MFAERIRTDILPRGNGHSDYKIYFLVNNYIIFSLLPTNV